MRQKRYRWFPPTDSQQRQKETPDKDNNTIICVSSCSYEFFFIFLLNEEKKFFYSLCPYGSEMKYFKKNTKNNRLAAVLVVLTVAITTTAVLATTTSLSSSFPITSNIAIPAASATPATTGNATNTTSTTITPPASSSSGVELSPQPIYEERSPPGAITPINETHGILTYSGNGMLTLPNTTETINTTHNGTAVLSFTTTSGQGKETIRTEDGSETATATVYEIVQFNNPAALGGEGKGIVTAVFQTNSTGVLAPLNGTIAVGVDNISPTDESHITLWKWESGIPLPTGATTGAEETPQMNTTMTTTTNATTTTTTTAPDTNATTAEGEEATTTPEEEPLEILGQ